MQAELEFERVDPWEAVAGEARTPRAEFDLRAGELAKERGISLAAAAKELLLEAARGIAVAICMKQLTVTADDVQEELARRGLPQLGNAAGALFRSKRWRFTGEWRKSRRTSNHAHQNRVWTFRRQETGVRSQNGPERGGRRTK